VFVDLRSPLSQTGPFHQVEGPAVTRGHTSLTLIRINRSWNSDCRAEGCLQRSDSRRGGGLQPRRYCYESLHPFKPGRVPGSSILRSWLRSGTRSN
jgi:hypothetical protein